MNRVLMLRHGATALMETHLCGRTPGIPLNDKGREQATALARRLPPLDALVTSPIDRAVETAHAIEQAQCLTAKVIPAFAEVDFGTWTGKRFDELQTDGRWQNYNRFRDRVGAPGGESMHDVQRRSLGALNELASDPALKGSVAIVTHGDVIRALLVWAAGTSVAEYWRFTADVASITEFLYEDGEFARILRVNDCAHLTFR